MGIAIINIYDKPVVDPDRNAGVAGYAIQLDRDSFHDVVVSDRDESRPQTSHGYFRISSVEIGRSNSPLTAFFSDSGEIAIDADRSTCYSVIAYFPHKCFFIYFWGNREEKKDDWAKKRTRRTVTSLQKE